MLVEPGAGRAGGPAADRLCGLAGLRQSVARHRDGQRRLHVQREFRIDQLAPDIRVGKSGAQFAFGLGHLIANTTGVVRFDHIQEKLGQIWNMVELTRSAIVAA